MYHFVAQIEHIFICSLIFCSMQCLYSMCCQSVKHFLFSICVQVLAIPYILKGRHVLCASETGRCYGCRNRAVATSFETVRLIGGARAKLFSRCRIKKKQQGFNYSIENQE